MCGDGQWRQEKCLDDGHKGQKYGKSAQQQPKLTKYAHKG